MNGFPMLVFQLVDNGIGGGALTFSWQAMQQELSMHGALHITSHLEKHMQADLMPKQQPFRASSIALLLRTARLIHQFCARG